MDILVSFTAQVLLDQQLFKNETTEDKKEIKNLFYQSYIESTNEYAKSPKLFDEDGSFTGNARMIVLARKISKLITNKDKVTGEMMLHYYPKLLTATVAALQALELSESIKAAGK